MTTSPKMVLTKRGAANQCVFAEVATLKAGGKASLTLKSHPGQGIGKKYLDERWAGPWAVGAPSHSTPSGCLEW